MHWYIKVRNTEASEAKKPSGLPVGKEYWRLFIAPDVPKAIASAEDKGYVVVQITGNLADTKVT